MEIILKIKSYREKKNRKKREDREGLRMDDDERKIKE